MSRNLSLTVMGSTLAVIAMGWLTLYSASYGNVRVSHQVFYDQLYCAILGFIIMVVLGRIDYMKFYDFAYVLYVLNNILLLLVLVGGRHALGARRWFEIGGVSFQPSELTKLAVILMLGRYFSSFKP